jgi:hypothetical protein
MAKLVFKYTKDIKISITAKTKEEAVKKFYDATGIDINDIKACKEKK